MVSFISKKCKLPAQNIKNALLKFWPFFLAYWTKTDDFLGKMTLINVTITNQINMSAKMSQI
jgi:hypothetical protein